MPKQLPEIPLYFLVLQRSEDVAQFGQKFTTFKQANISLAFANETMPPTGAKWKIKAMTKFMKIVDVDDKGNPIAPSFPPIDESTARYRKGIGTINVTFNENK